MPAGCVAGRRKTAITPWRGFASSSQTAPFSTRAIRPLVPRSWSKNPTRARARHAGRAVRANEALAARIRHKFRLKNTTGYSINALVDFIDPIDILAHLMIGSEGTLGFISEITYRTVPDYADKASALILFDDLETACRAVTRSSAARGSRRARRSRRAALRRRKAWAARKHRRVGPDGAALWSRHAPGTGALGEQVAKIGEALAGIHTTEPVRFSTDAEECARFWNVRKGMFPSVGAMREVGTTVIIEDVAFPVPRLAEATLDLQRLLRTTAMPTRSFSAMRSRATCISCSRRISTPPRSRALPRLHGRALPNGRRKIRWLAQGRAWNGTQHRTLRPARMGRRSACTHALDQAAARSQRSPQPGRHSQRRSRRAYQASETSARVRPDCRQVHRVRVLRAQVSVARSHAVPTAAHRRLAGDRAPRRWARRATRHDARALRLPRHRYLRRMRIVRDRLSGRHRNRTPHQSASWSPRRPGRASGVAALVADHYAATTACGPMLGAAIFCTDSSERAR